MTFKAAPLPHEWMIISIIGFFISWLYIFQYVGDMSPNAKKWGFTLMVFFLLMFIATMVSLDSAGAEDHDLKRLHPHKK